LEVFKGMEERRLPGETEAVWNLVRDGEVWTYRVWASPYLPEEIRAFPGCGQVVRMEREVVRKGTGEVRRTVSYALTSLGPEVADARRLGELLLSRWEVENRSFWVRDVLFREDACQVRGVGAQVLAALRAFLVSLLHRQGVREKKAALGGLLLQPPRCPALPGALCGIAVKSAPRGHPLARGLPRGIKEGYALRGRFTREGEVGFSPAFSCE
jgi:hypothetical protein